MMWNSLNVCEECAVENRSSVNEQSADVNQEEITCNEKRNNNEKKNNSGRRCRVDAIKFKGKIDEVKDEGVVRLFSVNCNGLGPQSSCKLEQIKKESNVRKIDGVMISSSDARWNMKNKTMMTNKLKSTNSNVIVNTSDSGEKVETGSFFLKGGTFTALWSTIANYVDRECMFEQKHGWWNSVMLKGNRKTIALITTCRLVDSETRGVNSSKAQCERAIGNVKRARHIRAEQLRELSEHVKTCGATDVIITGDFNESVCSTNIQNFMNETGLFDVFQEINGVDLEQRDATFEFGSKCVDYVLTAEGVLR